MGSFPGVWSEHVERRVPARGVMPADVAGDLDFGSVAGRERPDRVNELDLEPAEPRLGRSVIPTHPDPAHRRLRVDSRERIEPLA